jgi:multidrug efflux pump subunit AcrB
VEPRGDVAQFLDTASRMLAALGLSLIAVYCILAVLYRSYTLPLLIMLTVPLAAIGAFGSLFVFREPLNLYSMLGIIMLVGLVAKNGILLVEYAERGVREGIAASEAIVHAATARFRPILMTTFAMIAGMLPLALGATAGAEYRRALGIVVIGGLSTSLLLTLFVVPVAYALYRERGKRRASNERLRISYPRPPALHRHDPVS